MSNAKNRILTGILSACLFFAVCLGGARQVFAYGTSLLPFTLPGTNEDLLIRPISLVTTDQQAVSLPVTDAFTIQSASLGVADSTVNPAYLSSPKQTDSTFTISFPPESAAMARLIHLKIRVPSTVSNLRISQQLPDGTSKVYEAEVSGSASNGSIWTVPVNGSGTYTILSDQKPTASAPSFRYYFALGILAGIVTLFLVALRFLRK